MSQHVLELLSSRRIHWVPVLAQFAAFALVQQSMVRAADAEFRGAWVASVYNLDWPSSAGLPAATQQAQLRALLDRAASLKLTAILFQVRPASDALYESKIEP